MAVFGTATNASAAQGHQKWNAVYWQQKITGNIARDARHRASLKTTGWRVLVLWECQIKYPKRVTQRLRKFLDSEERLGSGSG